jgi:hypothetical protein
MAMLELKGEILDFVFVTKHSGNACYHSVQSFLSSRLLSKKIKNYVEYIR